MSSIKSQTKPFPFHLLPNRSLRKVATYMHYYSMASSSSSSHLKSLQEDHEGGDWLELGLGLGFRRKPEDLPLPVSLPLLPSASISSSSSPLQLQTNNQQIGLGLGLGLGLRFDNDHHHGVRHVGVLAPSSCNYHNLLWPDHYHHHHHNGIGMPSWPWHIDDTHDWQMPVPDDTHHHDYSTRRPQSTGLWFTLRSLTNRDGGEPGLPQIPKAYIRVKDENVTVFMVKKYLVRKLGLSNEAQIDISCMGQYLLHTQTLKQVRDAVWLPRLLESVDSTMSFEDSCDGSTQHLMSLYYSRRCELD